MQGCYPLFASFVIKKISTTQRDAPSVRDILDNSKKIADNFQIDSNKLFICECSKIWHLGKNIASATWTQLDKNCNVMDDQIRSIIMLAGNSRPTKETSNPKGEISIAHHVS